MNYLYIQLLLTFFRLISLEFVSYDPLDATNAFNIIVLFLMKEEGDEKQNICSVK